MVSAVQSRRPIQILLAVELVLLVALSLALRSYDLLRLPIFTDETTYLKWGAEIWEQRTRAALLIPLAQDGKQPLLMWLVGAAGQLIADPLLAARMVAALSGATSTAGVYLAGCWLADRRVGFVAALLYAVAPFTLFFERIALMEGPVTLGAVWAFALAVWIAGRVGDRRGAVLAGTGIGVALGVAIWTKMTALFVLPFPLLCALLLSKRERRAISATGVAAGYALFGVFAGVLALMPDSERLLEKASSFSIPARDLIRFPVELWQANGLAYWSWIQTYLPAPIWWLLLAAAVWGIVRRPRITFLLLGCWAVFTLPTVLTAHKQFFTTRYTVPGVFPLLLLTALFIVWVWDRLSISTGARAGRLRTTMAAVVLMAALLSSSLWFDARLLAAPESVELAWTDRYHFIVGWPAGYGFKEAVDLVKERATEITGTGQPVIVLADIPEGLPYDGLKLYLRGMPNVFVYVDRHLSRDPEGFLAAWRPHRVPLLVVGNEGRDDLEAFEQAVPQARRIGLFPKPTGRTSFRVYQVDVADLGQ